MQKCHLAIRKKKTSSALKHNGSLKGKYYCHTSKLGLKWCTAGKHTPVFLLQALSRRPASPHCLGAKAGHCWYLVTTSSNSELVKS